MLLLDVTVLLFVIKVQHWGYAHRECEVIAHPILHSLLFITMKWGLTASVSQLQLVFCDCGLTYTWGCDTTVGAAFIVAPVPTLAGGTS